jgi:lipid-A-disaccharide synthase
VSKSTSESTEILIIAAEASSARYASRLMRHWQSTGKNYRCFGIGSKEMEDLGFEILGRAEELAVVGFQEVVSHWSLIKKTFYALVDAAKERRPAMVLLLDYPDFNFRFAKKMKKLGLKVVYYISPQIWAWRKSRIKLVRRDIDKMLVVFPFEVDFYKKSGVEAEFVGHPLVEELRSSFFDLQWQKERRQEMELPLDKTVLGIMPGSRKSEIRHNLQAQLETGKLIESEMKDVKAVVLTAPTLDRDELEAEIRKAGFEFPVIKADPFEMIAVTDTVLCASGTATVMVGLLRKPMVIMYRMNSLTVAIARFFIPRPKYFGMVNLILDKEVAPEFFQNEANPKDLAKALKVYLSSSETRAKQAVELAKLELAFGREATTRRVADALEKVLKE